MSPSRTQPRPRRDRRTSGGSQPAPRPPSQRLLAGLSLQLFATGMLVGLAAGVVGMFAFTQPLRVDGPVAYEQQARFSYDTQVASSAAYPDGRVETGDPIFLRIVDGVPIRMSWFFASDHPAEVRGDGRLVARVTDGSGWETTIPLGPEQAWDGPEATLDGELDFAAIGEMADQVAEATGVAGGTRTIDVVAEIDLDGRIAGAELTRGFEPTISFRLDALRAVLATTGEADAAGSPLSQTDDSTVTAPGAEPNVVGFAGRSLSLATMRAMSLAGIAAAVVLVVAGLVAGWRRRDWDEHRRIADRHRDVVVEVAALSPAGDRSLVRVPSIEALAELARQRDFPVLKVPMREGGYGYVVDDVNARYRYLVRDQSSDGARSGADQRGGRTTAATGAPSETPLFGEPDTR